MTVSGRTVTLDAPEPVANAYGDGRLRWLGGGATGLESAVVASDGATLTLTEMPAGAGVGALVEAGEGCDRTVATCAGRFANAVNFRGEPYLPGIDLLTRYPGAWSAGERAAAAARACVGVRFLPQGRDPAIGLKLVGPGGDGGGARRGWCGEGPGGYALRTGQWHAAVAGLDPCDGGAIGDILLCRVSPLQLHIAVRTGTGIVHADIAAACVVERPGAPPWPVERAWRMGESDMATLVLTTVGGAIGGPVGAAIGAVLGQGIDRALLFPAPMRTGPRLTELSVQTSSYGTPVPRIFGTMRVAGSVIWATDLIETRTNQRGGKGRPGTTTYSYAASFAVALSARPIREVRRIWAEGKLLRGAAGDWKSATGFRLHRGTEEQMPDPLIASLVADAPAHRGIAYAVFEELQLADFGNGIPSLTFELVAEDDPVRVGAIAREIGEGAVTGDGPDDTVIGFAASGSSVAGALGALQDIAQAWAVPAGAAIRIDNRPGAARTVEAGVARSVREPVETVPVALSASHYDPRATISWACSRRGVADPDGARRRCRCPR
ncbi:phage BR0599 family protein [Sphingomonas sp. MMS24-JH45]